MSCVSAGESEDAFRHVLIRFHMVWFAGCILWDLQMRGSRWGEIEVESGTQFSRGGYLGFLTIYEDSDFRKGTCHKYMWGDVELYWRLNAVQEGKCGVICSKPHADGRLIGDLHRYTCQAQAKLASSETLLSCWSLEQLKLWDQKIHKDSEAGLLDWSYTDILPGYQIRRQAQGML